MVASIPFVLFVGVCVLWMISVHLIDCIAESCTTDRAGGARGLSTNCFANTAADWSSSDSPNRLRLKAPFGQFLLSRPAFCELLTSNALRRLRDGDVFKRLVFLKSGISFYAL